MSRLTRLRPAGLLAAVIAVLSVACDTDTIDLLPPGAGAIAGTSSGGSVPGGAGLVEITAGDAGTAGSNAGMGGLATASGGDGGNGGSFQNGGKGGGYGCFGFGCGGGGWGSGGTGGSGGNDSRCPDPSSPWCTPCNDSSDCVPQFNCASFSYCRPACTSSWECSRDGVCDPIYGTCGPCFSDPQCAADGIPNRGACELVLGRCVECNERVDCKRGDCVSLQCVICDDDKDCMGGRHCDKSLGKCF